MTTWYKLSDKKEIIALPPGEYPDYSDPNRIVKKDHLTISKIDVDVSTVFLCLDHSFSKEGPPLLFETMIFGGPYDSYQERYHTYKEALEGHNKLVEKLINGENPYS